MKTLTVIALLVLPFSLAEAQNAEINFSLQVCDVPVKTFDALGKYLEKGGQDAVNAYQKLLTLPGVEDLYSLNAKGRSGERGKASANGFEIEYDPVLSADGSQVDLNYAVEIPTKVPASFVGQVVAPVAEPFLINSWSNQEKVTALFVTAGVPGASPSREKADLNQVKCDFTVVKLGSREVESLSRMNARQAAETANREGRWIYNQWVLARSGNRCRAGRGNQFLELNPVLSADRKTLAINLTFSEDGESFSGSSTCEIGTRCVIALENNGNISPLAVLFHGEYQGTSGNNPPPPANHELPRFPGPKELVTHPYTVPPNLLMDLKEKAGLPPDARISPKDLLSRNGISLENGAAVVFNPAKGKLTFRNIESEHKKLFKLIESQ